MYLLVPAHACKLLNLAVQPSLGLLLVEEYCELFLHGRYELQQTEIVRDANLCGFIKFVVRHGCGRNVKIQLVFHINSPEALPPTLYQL